MAILAAAAASGERPPPGQVLALFPFSEDRRRETAVVRTCEGTVLAVTKGAPELVLGSTTLEEAERALWAARVGELAASAHKVIACAWRAIPDWPGGEPDRGYSLAGLVALEDPVREGRVWPWGSAPPGSLVAPRRR